MSVSAATAVASNPVKPSAWAPSEHTWALGHIPNLTWPLSIVAAQPTTATPPPHLRASKRTSSTLPDADSNSTATAIQQRCSRHLQGLLVFLNFLWVRETDKFPAEVKRITAARGRACALEHLYDPLDVERNL